MSAIQKGRWVHFDLEFNDGSITGMGVVQRIYKNGNVLISVEVASDSDGNVLHRIRTISLPMELISFVEDLEEDQDAFSA